MTDGMFNIASRYTATAKINHAQIKQSLNIRIKSSDAISATLSTVSLVKVFIFVRV